MTAPARHVAFLRGVGGPRPAPGDALRACFADAGYDRVTPVIATGNVVFGMGRKRKPPEAGGISAMLERAFRLSAAGDPEDRRGGRGDGRRRPVPRRRPGRFTRFVAMLGEDAPPADALPDPAPDAGYAADRAG